LPGGIVTLVPFALKFPPLTTPTGLMRLLLFDVAYAPALGVGMLIDEPVCRVP
jgi:hypothetical protein